MDRSDSRKEMRENNERFILLENGWIRRVVSGWYHGTDLGTDF